MSSLNLRSIISLVILGAGSLLLFQNCGGLGGGGKAPVDTTLGQSVSVVCQPTTDCLSYSLTTFGTQDCFANYNKVQVLNLPSVNGNNVTDVGWNNKCLIRSATEACCPTGVITASFSNLTGDRSISISFANSPTALLSSSNKMGAEELLTPPSATSIPEGKYNAETDTFMCGDAPCEMMQE